MSRNNTESKELNYELHITLPLDCEDFARGVAYDNPDWKFSKIDGDPVLGNGKFCYLTKHGDDPKKMREESAAFAGMAIRMKIEYTIFDSKSTYLMRPIVDVDGLVNANRVQVHKLNELELRTGHLKKQLDAAQQLPKETKKLLERCLASMQKTRLEDGDKQERAALLEKLNEVLK